MAPRDGLILGDDGRRRCFWGAGDPLYAAYHDGEWGFPVGDDRRLFEKICLEGFQAGLSWLTILKKRPAFRELFLDFDFERVARFGPRDISRLLGDARIVRHRGKIESTVQNARRACDLVEERGSLAAYFWSFEPGPRGRPRRVTRAALARLTTSPEAEAMSKDLKRRGWTFVGPTITYSFMQAMGLVDDHLDGCASRGEVEAARARFRRPAR